MKTNVVTGEYKNSITDIKEQVTQQQNQLEILESQRINLRDRVKELEGEFGSIKIFYKKLFIINYIALILLGIAVILK